MRYHFVKTCKRMSCFLTRTRKKISWAGQSKLNFYCSPGERSSPTESSGERLFHVQYISFSMSSEGTSVIFKEIKGVAGVADVDYFFLEKLCVYALFSVISDWVHFLVFNSSLSRLKYSGQTTRREFCIGIEYRRIIKYLFLTNCQKLFMAILPFQQIL